MSGPNLNLLLRGSAEIGADGLLRFYLLHIIFLPLAAIVLLSVHYYKVGRSHSISLPPKVDEGAVTPEIYSAAYRRIDFLPDILLHEVWLIVVGTVVLLTTAAFFYAAPLEHHADPQKTPFDTHAPWFFLWVQGLLKLGDRSLMGVIIPTLIVAMLLAVPYLDRNARRLPRKPPLALSLGALGLAALLILSYWDPRVSASVCRRPWPSCRPLPPKKAPDRCAVCPTRR